MFAWATEKFDKLSQTLAPPPTDAAGRFVYACGRADENAAMECLNELHDPGMIVQSVKGQCPLHLACEQSMTHLIRTLLQRGAHIQAVDGAGNTPLHLACTSTKQNALDTVKMLVTEFRASVIAKNGQGQTPYDMASLNMIRQYLLPLQLQEETRMALDNGGQGLPPGIDMGGLKISNNHMAPPPMAVGGMPGPPPPGGMPAPPQPGMPAPPPISGGAPPPAPTSGASAQAPSSGNHSYARGGYSSAVMSNSVYKPDGFHSSSSDKRLAEKYGHQPVGYAGASAVPPPPRSGNSLGAPPSSGGANPFAGGQSAFAAGGRPTSRYPAVDPVTGRALPSAPMSGDYNASSGYSNPGYYGAPAAPAYPTFGAAPIAPAPSTAPVSMPPFSSQAAAATTPSPSNNLMPPPPFSSQRPSPGTPGSLAPMSPPPKPFSSTPTQSAASIFSTPSPSTSTSQLGTPPGQPVQSRAVTDSTAGSSASSVFSPPPGQPMGRSLTDSTTGSTASSTASSLFSKPAAGSPFSRAPSSGNASELFSRPAQVVSPPKTQEAEAVLPTAENEEGEMDEVPLSPSPTLKEAPAQEEAAVAQDS